MLFIFTFYNSISDISCTIDFLNPLIGAVCLLPSGGELTVFVMKWRSVYQEPCHRWSRDPATGAMMHDMNPNTNVHMSHLTLKFLTDAHDSRHWKSPKLTDVSGLSLKEKRCLLLSDGRK